DEQFADAAKAAAGAGEPPVAPAAQPRALLAPHLDPRREGRVMARAYLEQGDAAGSPLRVVVFGTGHNLTDDWLALTRKRFETPPGRGGGDPAFAAGGGEKPGDAASRRELGQKDEHSLEFQVISLKRGPKTRRGSLGPILGGGSPRLLDDRRTPRDEPAV